MQLPTTRTGWLRSLAIVLVVGFAWMAVSRNQRATAPAAAEAMPRPGFLAPDFTLIDTSGTPLTLRETRGRPVVLNFWASWCGPCRVETPAFEALFREYDGAVSFIGVNQAESAAQIDAFAAEYDLTYPLLQDPDRAVNIVYRISGLPTTFILKPDGTIHRVFPGAVSEAALEDALAELLDAE